MTPQTEWLLLALASVLALWPILRRLRSLSQRATAVAAVLLLLSGVWAWGLRLEKSSETKSALFNSIPRQESFAGYVSSDKCQACHPDQHESWYRSFHRTMTQPATPDAVRASFDHVTLQLDDELYRLERRGDEFWAEMIDPDWIHDRAQTERDFLRGLIKNPPDRSAKPLRSLKRIGMVTGSHHFQAFWVKSERAGNVQFAFPFAWLIDEKRWVPRRDTFIRDPNQPLIQIWNMNCIQCHATAGQPQQDRSSNFATRIAEAGIACESCHGPAEEHIRLNADPLRRYQLHQAKSTDASIVNPSKLRSKTSAQVCGQCHAVKWPKDREQWLVHGSSFRPGQDLAQIAPLILPRRFSPNDQLPDVIKNGREFLNTMFWPDGVIRVAGRELNGIVETGCYERGQLSCLSCHSMHQSNPDDQLAKGMSGNLACLQCHESFREKLHSHTHHTPGSTGSQCYNCHMPHTTYGLLKAIRSHTIESPSVALTVKSGRMNACNLCHLDRTLDWTAKHLSQWFGQPSPSLDTVQQSVSAALVYALRGDAAQRALIAWNLGWEPARKISGENWIAPFLLQLLEDPYAAVRCIAYRSLKTFPGFDRWQYDFVGSVDQRHTAVQSAWEIWRQKLKAQLERHGAEVLLKADGELQQEAIDQLLLQRDNRPVELIE